MRTEDAAALIAEWLDGEQLHMERGAIELLRVAKTAEEAGEALEVYIRWRGLNPRKGPPDAQGKPAVMIELADVALSAMIAIASLGGDINAELGTRARHVMERLSVPHTLEELEAEDARAEASSIVAALRLTCGAMSSRGLEPCDRERGHPGPCGWDSALGDLAT